MGIVQLPMGKTAGMGAERFALRGGLARTGRSMPSLRLLAAGSPALAFCSGCASPIDFGAVWRGEEAFCSVQCSLAGDRPA